MRKARQRPQTGSTTKRPYQSPLRASQRDATRQAIVEAAETLVRTGPEALTVPEIAHRAGVSVPTVNRHFPSRQALLEAVVAQLDARHAHEIPRTFDPETFLESGLAAIGRDLFTRFSSDGSALTSSAAIWELRTKVTVPRRRKLAEETIASILPTLPEPHRTWLSDLLVVLLSSTTVHAMQGYLGLSPDEGAARLHWLLSALFSDARRVAEAGARREPRPRTGGAR